MDNSLYELQNITNDDFDSLITYSSNTAFTTPDPSNSSTAGLFADYFDRTYHSTNTTNASFQFDFRGTDIYVYGASGPQYGSYSVAIDGKVDNRSAYAARNATLPYLLFNSSGLSHDSVHSLVMTNLGSVNSGEGVHMLLDYIVTTVALAPAGATLVNTTVEDSNKTALTYSGTWNNNSDSLFSGGGTSYTNEEGANVKLSFYGTAIYVTGDANNDHGNFTVQVDNYPARSLRTPNGCGGAYGKFCEKTSPGVQFFQAYLNSSLHTITVTNGKAETGQSSYFDLDRFIYTTPSQYLSDSLTSGIIQNTTGVASTGQASQTTTGSGTGTASPSFHLGFGTATIALCVVMANLFKAFVS